MTGLIVGTFTGGVAKSILTFGFSSSSSKDATCVLGQLSRVAAITIAFGPVISSPCRFVFSGTRSGSARPTMPGINRPGVFSGDGIGRGAGVRVGAGVGVRVGGVPGRGRVRLVGFFFGVRRRRTGRVRRGAGRGFALFRFSIPKPVSDGAVWIAAIPRL